MGRYKKDCATCVHQEILHQYEPRWCNKFDMAVKFASKTTEDCFEEAERFKKRRKLKEKQKLERGK